MYTCKNATLLEITCRGSLYIHYTMYKCLIGATAKVYDTPCVRSVMDLAILRWRAGSSETSIVAYSMSTEISRDGLVH